MKCATPAASGELERVREPPGALGIAEWEIKVVLSKPCGCADQGPSSESCFRRAFPQVFAPALPAPAPLAPLPSRGHAQAPRHPRDSSSGCAHAGSAVARKLFYIPLTGDCQALRCRLQHAFVSAALAHCREMIRATAELLQSSELAGSSFPALPRQIASLDCIGSVGKENLLLSLVSPPCSGGAGAQFSDA